MQKNRRNDCTPSRIFVRRQEIPCIFRSNLWTKKARKMTIHLNNLGIHTLTIERELLRHTYQLLYCWYTFMCIHDTHAPTLKIGIRVTSCRRRRRHSDKKETRTWVIDPSTYFTTTFRARRCIRVREIGEIESKKERESERERERESEGEGESGSEVSP